MIFKNNGVLCTWTYRKVTATNTLLRAESHHPQALIRGIPIGQFLRIWRNCSLDCDYEQQAEELTQRLTNRGYSKQTISTGYEKAKQSNRTELIFKNKQKQTKVRFITDYNSQWYDIQQVLKRNWDILLADPELKCFLVVFPSMTARRAPSLKDNLNSSHFVNNSHGKALTWLPEPEKEMHKCGHCKCCKYVKKFSDFTHLQNKTTYKINNFPWLIWYHSQEVVKTTAVVYVIECSCPMRYVGKTFRSLGKRILEHWAETQKNLRMFGIEQVSLGIRGGEVDKTLLQKELRWMYELNTY
ncbi:hypothetical protein XELAEV_18033712mg [Xenopus laevis]|uniref:Helix-turn-helix domain-containing protein n=1 Tax=Xenopus laevis TaxID=8355 RepID=A0A974CJT2_XENLA|nr:hypothetical protein XELAEV_18033712mg [Xenopus laevis]